LDGSDDLGGAPVFNRSVVPDLSGCEDGGAALNSRGNISRFTPHYSRLTSEGLGSCRICPHDCGKNRNHETGFCQAKAALKVNLAQLHFGEEPMLSGTRGSGTIFFSNCNLRCVYCQNYTISQIGHGDEVSSEELVRMMLDLQGKGAHNINFVTPSHYSLQLVPVIKEAREQGLKIPIVWNSNAYDKVETLALLDGLVDIYLPDLKYAHSVYALKYSSAKDYPAVSRAALKEMHDQAGKLQVDEAGIAVKGLIIRLLVLPNGLSGTKDTLHWIAEELGRETHICLMAQYYPAHQASKYPELARGITEREYDAVCECALALDLPNVLYQELSCSADWTPDFKETRNCLNG